MSNPYGRVVFGSLSAIKQIGMSSRYIPKVTFSEEVLDKIFKCKGLGTVLCGTRLARLTAV